MSTAMFDAREVLIPGSAYDRSASSAGAANGGGGLKFDPNSFVRHDQLGFIGHERNLAAAAAAAGPGGVGLGNMAGVPVPVNMFMPPPMQHYHHQAHLHGECT